MSARTDRGRLAFHLVPQHGPCSLDLRRAMQRPVIRDRFFDQWLICGTDRLRELADMAMAMIDHVETHFGKRVRRRRQADVETLRALVETVIANLAYAAIDRSGARTIAVSLSKAVGRTRYDRPIFRQLPKTLEVLESHGLLRFHRSQGFGLRSIIEPTPWLIGKLDAAGAGFADFARHDAEEVIILTRMRKGFREGAAGEPVFGKQRERIDYPQDTAESLRFRKEVRTINAALAAAHLSFDDRASSRIIVDTHRRRLRRYFSLPLGRASAEPRFDLGGRLFGGWWQNLARSERHRIRIDDEEAVDLDYAGMFPRLAYLSEGVEPPEGDLYAVPGLEGYRDGVKRMMNTLLFATGDVTRIPSDFRRELPEEWTGSSVRKALVAHHPRLEPAFERGIGLSLMFAESQILVAVLLRLHAEGIIALPMHDGIMAPASRSGDARTIMEEVAEEKTGFRLPVAEKAL